MMRKRIFLAATWAALLSSAGCLRDMCERHGYYPPAPPAAYAPQCCVPVCQPAPAGYVAPVSSGWNQPAAVPACPQGCVPAR